MYRRRRTGRRQPGILFSGYGSFWLTDWEVLSRNDSARPNILWYCTDQQRFDTIGALGNPHVHTPNLDRMVGGGVAFTHAYCQSPICTPSRASFLTECIRARSTSTATDRSTSPRNTPWLPECLPTRATTAAWLESWGWPNAEEAEEPRAESGYRYYEYSNGPQGGTVQRQRLLEMDSRKRA